MIICAYKDCNKEGTCFAIGLDEGYKEVAIYCEAHADSVADQGNPEYRVSCPQCGCAFGV